MNNSIKMILNIETSGDLCAVGIGTAEGIIARRELHIPNIHSEKLAELVKDCLIETSTGVKNLSAIAVSAGPGSFTGLRIGLSLAKGMAYGANVPLIGISTLRLLCLSANLLDHENRGVIALIDARRDQFYWSRVEKTESGIIETKPSIDYLDKIIEISQKEDTLVGYMLKSDVVKLIDSTCNRTFKNLLPDISIMHDAALVELAKNNFQSIDDFEPHYLRAFAGII